MLQQVLAKIKDHGGRKTAIREAIINAFKGDHRLLLQKDILSLLDTAGLHPNRSTMFREINFLLSAGIINKSELSGQDYYELNEEHHYHFVCENCQAIIPVEIDDDLQKQQTKLMQKYHFKIASHDLDFKGICGNCLKL